MVTVVDTIFTAGVPPLSPDCMPASTGRFGGAVKFTVGNSNTSKVSVGTSVHPGKSGFVKV